MNMIIFYHNQDIILQQKIIKLDLGELGKICENKEEFCTDS